MKNKLILFLIIILGLFLRLYKLDQYPVSLSWDEVAIGYNSYSLSKTGADEYGAFYPLLFKSFNDYKLPGYFYIDTFLIKYFGLNQFTVRLPSAILGTFAIFVIYFLTKELFFFSKDKNIVALISSGLLAVSPWHLQFSRAAFESNLSLTIFLAGTFLFIKGLENRLFAFFSTPVLAFSIYFYYSTRLVAPMLIVLALLIFRIFENKNIKYYIAGTFFALLISSPILLKTFSHEGIKRINEVSIFSDLSVTADFSQARSQNNNIGGKIFLNTRIPQTFQFLHNYTSNLSLGFLFFGDDPNPRHKSATHGLLYFIELPLLFIGLWSIFRMKEKKAKYFLLSWVFIAPIPASLSRESPHALRSLILLPPLIIFLSKGIFEIIKVRWVKPILIIFYIFSFINYLYSYYILYPLKFDQAWAYGYKQVFEATNKEENNYDKIIVTGYNWKPYIFYLFYNKIDPNYYQKNSNQLQIGKYVFGNAVWDGGKNLTESEIDKIESKKALIVLSPQEFEQIPKNRFTTIDLIKDYSQAKTVFYIGSWQ